MPRPTDNEERKKMNKYDKKNKKKLRKEMKKLRDRATTEKYKRPGGITKEQRETYSSEEFNAGLVAQELRAIVKLLNYKKEDDIKVKNIDIKEFREFGFLQEVNRQFLHPLGMALEITIDDNGDEKISGIWDHRDDPEGIIFVEVDQDKIKRVAEFAEKKAEARKAEVGFIIQEK